ncbi:MAG TPA: hypothetical protein VFA68_13515 [Terriglobales bacterium]|nr:hypothetical protein [Terriglobales bacterium]
MSIRRLAILSIGFFVSALAFAQEPRFVAAEAFADRLPWSVPGDGPLAAVMTPSSRVELPSSTPIPQLGPDLALSEYEQRATRQAEKLAGYTAKRVIKAALPETAQYGEYELEQRFAAPRNLEFKPIRFTGDGFVKSNIITRLLQSEVDHLQKDDTSLTALNSSNYKFSYKGKTQVGSQLVHVYQVKPRKKRVGLFKGRIYLSSQTGSLVRAEGTLVKSPSFFIKKIDFVQDYCDFNSFTFPVHIHSEAATRLIGRTIIDMFQSDYQPVKSETSAQILGTR